MRDYQRKRFYTLFHNDLTSMRFNEVLEDVNQANSLVEKIVAHPIVSERYEISDLKASVRMGRSSRFIVYSTRAAKGKTSEYLVEGSDRPVWVGVPLEVVLQTYNLTNASIYQLMAFALARRHPDQQGSDMAWHGWQYMEALATIVEAMHGSEDKALLVAAYRTHKIVYSDPAGERTPRDPAVDAKAFKRLNIEFHMPNVFWSVIGANGWIATNSSGRHLYFTQHPGEVKLWKTKQQSEQYIKSVGKESELQVCEAPKLALSAPKENTGSHVLWSLNPDRTSSGLFDSPGEEYLYSVLFRQTRPGIFHEMVLQKKWEEFKESNDNLKNDIHNYLNVCNQYRIDSVSFVSICSLMTPTSSEELETWMRYRVFSVPETTDIFHKSSGNQFFSARAVTTRQVAPEVLGLWMQYAAVKGKTWLRVRYDCEFNGAAMKHNLMKRSDRESYALLRSDFLPFPFVPVTETNVIMKEWGIGSKWEPKYEPYRNKNLSGTRVRYGLWLPPVKGEFPFKIAASIWKQHCDNPDEPWSALVLNAYS